MNIKFILRGLHPLYPFTKNRNIPWIWVPRPEIDISNYTEVIADGWIVFQEEEPNQMIEDMPWHSYKVKKL